MDNLRGDTVNGIGKVSLVQFAFPYDDDRPPMSLQLAPDLLIPSLVSLDFRCPELRISLWDGILATPLVSMPKTPMHKYYRPVPRQHHIRTPRQPPIIHPIPKPPPPQLMPENNLRLRIGGMNCGHVRMALGRRDGVRHKDILFLANIVNPTLWQLRNVAK